MVNRAMGVLSVKIDPEVVKAGDVKGHVAGSRGLRQSNDALKRNHVR